MGLSLSCVIGTTRCMALFVLFLMVSNASAGEWVDLSKELGWSTFKNGRPFDFRDNLRYCNKTYTKLSNSDTNESWHVKIHKELRKLQKRGGGTLLLGYGTYYLSAQVKLPSYTCLIGRGMNQTILKLVDNATTFKQAGMVRSKHTERVTIARLTIDGNRAKQNSTDIYKGAYGRFGIFTHLTNYLYIYQVRARNQAGYGMDPHGSKEAWAYFLILDQCEANNNGLDGFTLDQTLYVSLTNSSATDNDRHGVNIVTGTRYCRVAGNIMRGNGYRSAVGCSMMGQNNQNYTTSHLNFTDNELLDGRKSGFCFNNVTSVSITHNTIKNERGKAFCYYFDKTRHIGINDTKCTTKGIRVRNKDAADYDFLR